MKKYAKINRQSLVSMQSLWICYDILCYILIYYIRIYFVLCYIVLYFDNTMIYYGIVCENML